MSAGIAWTLAALPDAEAARLPALERAATDVRRAMAGHAALADGRSADDAALAEREAVAIGITELATIAALWPATAADVRRVTAALGAPPRASASRDPRVPERTGTVHGPLEVYYYDHLTAVLGRDAQKTLALAKRDELFTYEALNLVDGKRTIGEIRDLLAGRYAPVPLAEVAAWFELLAKTGVVRLRAR